MNVSYCDRHHVQMQRRWTSILEGEFKWKCLQKCEKLENYWSDSAKGVKERKKENETSHLLSLLYPEKGPALEQLLGKAGSTVCYGLPDPQHSPSHNELCCALA